jgi:hypothetical protein
MWGQYRAMFINNIRTVFSMHCIMRRFFTVFAFAMMASGLKFITALKILCASGARVLTITDKLFKVAVVRAGSL